MLSTLYCFVVKGRLIAKSLAPLEVEHQILRCWCSTPSGDKLFAINLPFTTKQYKVDKLANFVYYGKTRIETNSNLLRLALLTQTKVRVGTIKGLQDNMTCFGQLQQLYFKQLTWR